MDNRIQRKIKSLQTDSPRALVAEELGTWNVLVHIGVCLLITFTGCQLPKWDSPWRLRSPQRRLPGLSLIRMPNAYATMVGQQVHNIRKIIPVLFPSGYLYG
jgi:hypothetical protein